MIIMTRESDAYWVELAEAAAKQAFETIWSQGLAGEFEAWHEDAALQLYTSAFMEGAIFCANVSGVKLPLIKPQEEQNSSDD
jgi:uncharacterized protein YyaL (SSP411 family)